ncbi:MAG TPA: hypothetical protein PLV68_04645, partial [Ilumatobacteraceae bacterium]|nr:hypothetical protein [Ilumatobacteraceae bacterium]
MSTGTGALVDRVGVRLDADVSGHARLPLSAAIERNGHVLASPLMLAADIASGIRLHRPDVESVLTASFSFRRTDRRPLGAVTAAATRLWEHGRRVIDDVEYLDEAGEQVGFGRIAFTVLGRRDGGSDADGSDAAAFSRFMTPRVDPIDTPLIDAAGIELVDAAVGHARFRPEQDVGDRSVGDRGVAPHVVELRVAV